MRTQPSRWLLLFGVGALLAGCHSAATRPTTDSAGALGQKQCVPEVYGAGVFSTGAWDFFMAFTPDQKRVIFGRADDAFEHFDLYETRLGDDGVWSAPVKPRFATEWSNADAHLSPDGRTVFFISNRPLPGETQPRTIHDLWTATLQPDGEWSEARRLPAPVNLDNTDVWSPSVAANGNLYFGGERPGTRGDSDLWVSRLVDGVYQSPENLGDAINTSGLEVEPWIAPDESYLLFAGLRRADSLGSYDLYLSRRQPDGSWEKPRILCEGINSPQRDFNHSVSPDGKWLYFSSNRPHTGATGPRFDVPRDDTKVNGIGNGLGDIYRIPMSAIGL